MLRCTVCDYLYASTVLRTEVQNGIEYVQHIIAIVKETSKPMFTNRAGNPPKTKVWQTFKTLQKTETAIFIYIYTHLWPSFSFYNNLYPLTRIF